MIDWLQGLSGLQLTLLVLAVLVALLVVSPLLTWLLVRRGLRTPFAIRQINKVTARIVEVVKRPITIAVLDEVADVIQTGHYTQNISAALRENHTELVALVREKVRQDPASRVVGLLPGYDTVIEQVSETTLRVVVEMLSDPRMDELVADLLRNNLQQIRQAVRTHEHKNLPPPRPPDPAPPRMRR